MPCPVRSSSRRPARRSASSRARSRQLQRDGPRRCRDQGRARARRDLARAGRLRDHGPGAPGRRRARSPRARRRVKAGIPMTIPAITINKVCLSGINAIYLADQMIQAGDADVVVAGGMESMTNAPYLLPKARGGYRMGNGEIVDSTDPRRSVVRVRRRAHGLRHRAVHGDFGGLTRERQDDLAAKSHERAASAMKEGRFADEIVAGRDPQRKGDPIVVEDGRGRPARHDGGVARQACARRSQGRHDHRRQRVADLRRRGGGDRHEPRAAEARRSRRSPSSSATAWSPAPTRRCSPSRRARSSARSRRRASRSPTSTCSSSTRRSPPSGSRRCATSASPTTSSTSTAARSPSATRSACRARGSRITLVNELRRRGGGLGAAALCGGGGQGDAAIVRTL